MALPTHVPTGGAGRGGGGRDWLRVLWSVRQGWGTVRTFGGCRFVMALGVAFFYLFEKWLLLKLLKSECFQQLLKSKCPSSLGVVLFGTFYIYIYMILGVYIGNYYLHWKLLFTWEIIIYIGKLEDVPVWWFSVGNCFFVKTESKYISSIKALYADFWQDVHSFAHREPSRRDNSL